MYSSTSPFFILKIWIQKFKTSLLVHLENTCYSSSNINISFFKTQYMRECSFHYVNISHVKKATIGTQISTSRLYDTSTILESDTHRIILACSTCLFAPNPKKRRKKRIASSSTIAHPLLGCDRADKITLIQFAYV